MAFRWYTAVFAVVLSIMLLLPVLPSEGLPGSRMIVASAQPLDTDGDGVPDAIDGDKDGDGVDDWADYAPLDPDVQNAPPPAADPPVQSPDPVAPEVIDSDGDGIPDNADFDNDNDGVIDSEDHEPFNPPVQYPPVAPENPGGDSPPPNTDTGTDYDQDSDGDGIPSHLDPDDDNDAIEDRDDPVPTPREDRDDPVPTPIEEESKNPSAPKPPTSGGGTENQEGGPISRNTTSSAVPLVSALPKTGSGSATALPVLSIVVVASLGILGVHIRSKNPSER